MRSFPIVLCAAVLMSSASAQIPGDTGTRAPLMTPREFQALPAKPADKRIVYGEDPNQHGDLRLPSGPGLHPVVVLIHGGCFTARYANLVEMGPVGDALKAKGIATWNIEYRRLGQPGGGWPGTYLDVGRAIDHLRTMGAAERLDLERVVVLGHSAGGHLGMWAVARRRLAKDSPLYTASPLPLAGVVNLAGPPDLEDYLAVAKGACGPDVVESFLGGKPGNVAPRYAQVSASRMLPLGVPQVLVWGQRDDMNPLSLGQKFSDAARRAGDSVKLITFPDAGHFEIASPLSPTWPAIEREILLLLKMRVPGQ